MTDYHFLAAFAPLEILVAPARAVPRPRIPLQFRFLEFRRFLGRPGPCRRVRGRAPPRSIPLVLLARRPESRSAPVFRSLPPAQQNSLATYWRQRPALSAKELSETASSPWP